MALQTINIGTSANDGTGDPLRTAMDKVNDNFALLDTGVFNVKDPAYGAVGNGTTDDTAAFTAVWAAVLATQVVVSNNNYVKNYVYIPPGTYRVSGSINWTDLFAWNVCVIAYGAVILADGANKNVIDLTNSRGVHIKGLTIKGDSTNVPDCGILLGPDGTSTNGNNALQDVKVIGEYDIASVINLGSETTEHIAPCGRTLGTSTFVSGAGSLRG